VKENGNYEPIVTDRLLNDQASEISFMPASLLSLRPACERKENLCGRLIEQAVIGHRKHYNGLSLTMVSQFSLINDWDREAIEAECFPFMCSHMKERETAQGPIHFPSLLNHFPLICKLIKGK